MLHQFRDEGAFRLRKWQEVGDEARGRFARMIGASPEEVAFIKNTSEGISFIAAGFPWKEGDNLVTANVEFPSNVYPWMRLTSHNVEVRMVPAREGRVRKEDLFAACDGKTRLIALSSVEFANGHRNDLPGIGEFCQKKGIFFFVDAIQSLGVLPMDVRSYGIDALAADGHKWMLSPEGIGGFYISRDVMEMVEPVVLGWHSVQNRFDFENYDFRLSPDARRFEPGSFNSVGLAAFNASLDLLLSIGVDRIWERVRRRSLRRVTLRIARASSPSGFPAPILRPSGRRCWRGTWSVRPAAGGSASPRTSTTLPKRSPGSSGFSRRRRQ
jgi:selenocysteine lyase/cysteine desulfurase